MKLRHCTVFVLLALCPAGCASAPTPSPSTSVPSTESSTETPPESGLVPGATVTLVPNGGGGGKTTPSTGKARGGALGSPIDYDPSFVGQSLDFAEKQIKSDLATKCAPASCDVGTKPKYQGAKGSGADCFVTGFSYAKPLRRGATITIEVKCSPVSSENTTTSSSSSR